MQTPGLLGTNKPGQALDIKCPEVNLTTDRQARDNDEDYGERGINILYMNLFDFGFSFIFKGYQNKGEKYSAHIYALCIITIFLGFNLLSIIFISLSERYLRSKEFKEIAFILFAVLFIINAFYFLWNKRYLRMAAQYQELEKENKRKGKIFIWVYVIASLILLIFSFSL